MGRAEDLRDRIVAGGERAIEELILDRVAEELFLDFKRSADSGRGSTLHDNDRNNLAKAISGFGNGAGGVIVWGIECSTDNMGADVASAKKPIFDAQGFVSRLESAISGCTLPVHPGVTNHVVLSSCPPQGYALTYIPESRFAPHQTVRGMQYHIRAGSAFVPAPHNVLAGLFGKKPQPNLVQQIFSPKMDFHQDRIEFEVGFVVNNYGMSIARDPYISIAIEASGGSASRFEMRSLDQNWTGAAAFGMTMFLCARHPYVLPPGGIVIPLAANIVLKPPFTDGFKYTRRDGCEGMEPRINEVSINAEALQMEYERLLRGHTDNGGETDHVICQDFVEKLFLPSKHQRMSFATYA